MNHLVSQDSTESIQRRICNTRNALINKILKLKQEVKNTLERTKEDLKEERQKVQHAVDPKQFIQRCPISSFCGSFAVGILLSHLCSIGKKESQDDFLS